MVKNHMSDLCRLLEMPEIEREELLATRQEEMQRLQDKHNIDHMLKAQSGNMDSEHVSQAAKRESAVIYRFCMLCRLCRT